MTMAAESSADEIVVAIKVNTGQKFNLTLTPSMTVLEAKQKAETETEIPSGQQRLIYRGMASALLSLVIGSWLSFCVYFDSLFVFVVSSSVSLFTSGRILKDPDTISSYGISTGHTIHLVSSPSATIIDNNGHVFCCTTNHTYTL